MSKCIVRSVVVWLMLAVASVSGCTSMRLVESTDGAALPSAIEIGDRVRVLDGAGLSTDFEVTAIGSDFVEGRMKNDQVVRIAFTDLREVRERRPAWGKTALLGAGVGYIVAAAVTAAALASFW
jgi:hypothetical protein